MKGLFFAERGAISDQSLYDGREESHFGGLLGVGSLSSRKKKGSRHFGILPRESIRNDFFVVSGGTLFFNEKGDFPIKRRSPSW